MTCTCGHIKIGSEVTDARSWNPDCVEHGTASRWWRSDAQVAAREAQSGRLRAMQVEVRRVRNGGAPKPLCVKCGGRHFEWDGIPDHKYRPAVTT